jgi:short-subunit dehydrogenase
MLIFLSFKKKPMSKSNQMKYALVTGSTSGIGYELAKRAAIEGYNLILVARQDDQLQKVQNDLQKYNVEVITIQKDLFNPKAAKEIHDEVTSRNIPVSILINDAGQGQHGKFIESDLSRNLDIIQLNVSSLVALTYYFMKDMVSRNEGKILQLGSEVSKSPTPLMAVYAATKAFVLSFTEALVNELKDTNVTMTLLMPGATDTDFFDKADAEDTVVYREMKLEEPESVAKDAWEALLKGERRIIAMNAKKNVAMANMSPDNVVAKKMRKTMEDSEKTDDVRTEPTHKQSKDQ